MPERFKALVSLPLPHVDASLREMQRGLDELGMAGVNIHCSVLGRAVVEDDFLPLYEELNRRHAVVLFHPTGNGALSPLVNDFGLGGAIGTSIEDTLVAMHLIARRIPSRYPDITFIVPHLGGPIGMLLQRIDNQFSMQSRDLPEPPSVTARRLLLRHGGTRVARGAAVRVESVRRGSPGARAVTSRCCWHTRRTPGRSRGFVKWACPEADVELILEKNAARVLGG